MNALESQLDYCLGTATPEPGRVFEVAQGVLWARMRLPFRLDHINVWLLRDPYGGEVPAAGGPPGLPDDAGLQGGDVAVNGSGHLIAGGAG